MEAVTVFIHSGFGRAGCVAQAGDAVGHVGAALFVGIVVGLLVWVVGEGVVPGVDVGVCKRDKHVFSVAPEHDPLFVVVNHCVE